MKRYLKSSSVADAELAIIEDACEQMLANGFSPDEIRDEAHSLSAELGKDEASIVKYMKEMGYVPSEKSGSGIDSNGVKVQNLGAELPNYLANATHKCHVTCDNPTYADDLLEAAQDAGLYKVRSYSFNPSTGRMYMGMSWSYVGGSDIQYILTDIVNSKGLPGITISGAVPIDWKNQYNIYVDDYFSNGKTIEYHKTR